MFVLFVVMKVDQDIIGLTLVNFIKEKSWIGSDFVQNVIMIWIEDRDCYMQKHESYRGYFAYELNTLMDLNPDIYLLLGDLGYGAFDYLRERYPDRCINCGASEQAMMGIAVGMALSGKIPVVYSITNFLLYRPFETIRNYINYEKIPVKLVAAGRDKDYKHDGISHWSEDAQQVLAVFHNIKQYFPDEKTDITTDLLQEYLYNNKPSYISLKR